MGLVGKVLHRQSPASLDIRGASEDGTCMALSRGEPGSPFVWTKVHKWKVVSHLIAVIANRVHVTQPELSTAVVAPALSSEARQETPSRG